MSDNSTTPARRSDADGRSGGPEATKKRGFDRDGNRRTETRPWFGILGNWSVASAANSASKGAKDNDEKQ